MTERTPDDRIRHLSELHDLAIDRLERSRQRRAQARALLARVRARHRAGAPPPPLGDAVLYRHGHGPSTQPVTD